MVKHKDSTRTRRKDSKVKIETTVKLMLKNKVKMLYLHQLVDITAN